MQAVIFNGTPTPQVVDVPIPTRERGQVLLRVLRAGICGTDLSILSGKHPRARAPLIMGHEIAAVIEQADADSGFAAGELVTVEPILSCGHCPACRSGVPHVCDTLKLYGIDAPGGMADFMVVATDRVVRVPESLGPDEVVFVEPTAVAVHAVRLSGIRYGDRVGVLGGGPIGVLVAMAAARAGAGSLFVAEPEPGRRTMIESLGFKTLDPASVEMVHAARRWNGGADLDVVFECAGAQPSIDTATQLLRSRGRLVQVAMPKEPRTFNIIDLTFKELTVQGVRVYEAFDFNRALELLAVERARVAALRSRPYALHEAVAAFEAARAGNQGMRVIFRVAD